MADYGELVELGFEGVDRFADKYHDKVYDRLPAGPKGRKKYKDPKPVRNRRDLQDNQRYLKGQEESKHPDKGYPGEPSAPLPPHPADPNGDQYDEEMQAPYGQSGGRNYPRYADEGGYYGDERAPGPGFRVPRGARENYDGTRALQPYGDQPGYGRPSPQRRGSSWSPPRSERYDRDTRRARSRSRKGDRDRAGRDGSESNEKQHRLLAMAGGALLGGLAGNQARKGKKYDTVATIVGAIAGGVGAREATEYWEDRKKKKGAMEDEWEGGYGDDEGRRDDSRGRDDSRRRDDRYDREGRYDRYDRDDRRRY